MNLKIGIVGLPNVGKSTLFNALTRKKVDISNYPFCTIEPNLGAVEVPDERLILLSKLVPEAKVLPAVIEVADVAGLIKGAHQGQGLGNQFLSHLFPMNAILLLLRCFRDEKIQSLADDPDEQFEILQEELAKKDEEILDRYKNKKQLDSAVPDLGNKPQIIVCNLNGQGVNYDFNGCQLEIDSKLELELSELEDKDKRELGIESQLPKLVKLLYQTLGLITFYTIKGGKELRAWPFKKGTKAPEAGGIVHSDFAEKFIRAEVISWDKLLGAGSWLRAKELGWVRTEGKEYIVQDGDAIEFKI